MLNTQEQTYIKPTVSVTTVSGPKPRRDMQGYLDETGLLHNQDRYFGQGLLISPNINPLHRRLIRYRDSISYYGEYKFTNVTSKNVNLYKGLIDQFFTEPYSIFSIRIHDKSSFDLPKIYSNNMERAYNASAARLITSSLRLCESDKTSDYLTVLADDVSTSKDDKFEKDVRQRVKKYIRRNAISNIIRLESHAVTEIQLVDVLLGSVAYAYKIHNKVLPAASKHKIELVNHIKKHLGVPSLAEPLERKVRNGIRFSIVETEKY